MCACSCNEGYEGAYCQVAATSVTDLPLLVSLSTLLPVAAILVVIITIILIYRRLRTTQDVTNSRRHRNNVRPRYDVCMCSDQFIRVPVLSLTQSSNHFICILFTVVQTTNDK